MRSWTRLLLAVALGCGVTPEDRELPHLEALPKVDLDAAEAEVRLQLEAALSSLNTELEAANPDPAAAAVAFGDLGLLLVAYEIIEPARICFVNAGRLQRADHRWPYLEAYALALQGKLGEAAGGYRRSLEIEPGFLPAHLRMGRVRFEMGDAETARQHFERAVELAPEVAAGHEGLGRVAAFLGLDAEAVGHYERALQLEPSASAVRYALAQSQRNLGRPEIAAPLLARAGDVATAIPDPLITPLASRIAGVDFYLLQGSEALDDRRYEASAAAYRTVLKRDPKNLPASRGLALSLENLGDPSGAEEVLGAAVEATDDVLAKATLLSLRGDLLQRSGREEEGLTHLRASLALVPDQPAVLLKTANALARRRSFEEAIALYDRLLEVAPERTAEALEKRATALINLGRSKEAIADFARAVELAPETPELRLRFARALEHLGRLEAAADQRAQAHAPGTARSDLAAEAARLRRSGDFRGALARYRELLAQHPTDPRVRAEIAGLLGYLGDYDGAVAEFAQLLDLEPRNAAAHRGRILALILGERYREARVALQEALRLFSRSRPLALTQVRLLATAPDAETRDPALALEIAGRVHAQQADSATRAALALSLAAASRFSEAQELQRRCVEEAGSAAAGELAQSRLEAFKRQTAWTARSPAEILVDLAPDSP